MTQGSQLKAMDSYFKSLLSETVTDNVPQVVPVKAGCGGTGSFAGPWLSNRPVWPTCWLKLSR